MQANLVDKCDDGLEENLDNESIELEDLALQKSKKYVLDSGASSHVISNRSTLISYQLDSFHSSVSIASETRLHFIGKVSLRVDSSSCKEIKPILYVSDVTKNLL